MPLIEQEKQIRHEKTQQAYDKKKAIFNEQYSKNLGLLGLIFMCGGLCYKQRLIDITTQLGLYQSKAKARKEIDLLLPSGTIKEELRVKVSCYTDKTLAINFNKLIEKHKGNQKKLEKFSVIKNMASKERRSLMEKEVFNAKYREKVHEVGERGFKDEWALITEETFEGYVVVVLQAKTLQRMKGNEDTKRIEITFDKVKLSLMKSAVFVDLKKQNKYKNMNYATFINTIRKKDCGSLEFNKNQGLKYYKRLLECGQNGYIRSFDLIRTLYLAKGRELPLSYNIAPDLRQKAIDILGQYGDTKNDSGLEGVWRTLVAGEKKMKTALEDKKKYIGLSKEEKQSFQKHDNFPWERGEEPLTKKEDINKWINGYFKGELEKRKSSNLTTLDSLLHQNAYILEVRGGSESRCGYVKVAILDVNETATATGIAKKIDKINVFMRQIFGIIVDVEYVIYYYNKQLDYKRVINEARRIKDKQGDIQSLGYCLEDSMSRRISFGRTKISQVSLDLRIKYPLTF